jgi:2-polyprenyl-6-methoxyphenol hydroxylase-like FAD-dependent oxidoreductase
MARHHAVVLGAGIAGLLSARVLSEHYDRVTLLDRDELPLAGEHRRGTPQDRHPHLLLARGARALEELYPGLLADLEAGGVPVLREFADAHLTYLGHTISRAGRPSEPMYQASRPLLESQVRARRPSGVEVSERVAANGLRCAGGRVVAVHVRTPCGDDDLPADLVVDATGRGGRTAKWLPGLGFRAPAESRVEVDVCYVSARLRLPDSGDLHRAMLVSATPARPWGIAGGQIEGDQWLVTAYGYRGHHPTPDDDGILAAFKELAPPGWADALAAAHWPERPAVHRFPYSVRRRYERLRRVPEGLVVVGDGLCSFNPLYGQGMTIAALQALALRDCLAAGDDDLSRRFFRAAARTVDLGWRLSVATDLGFPAVPGRRPVWTGAARAATDAILAAAEHDPEVRDAFLRVSWLLDPPTRLARPDFLRRVLRRPDDDTEALGCRQPI